MKILIIGDVYSKLGRTSLERNLRLLKEREKINFIIVNGENTSHGNGLNQNHYQWYMTQGVNAVTLGNHAFGNKAIYNFIDDVNNIIRPLNYPGDEAGRGYQVINYNGVKICIMQVMGRVFMNGDLADPFKAAQDILDQITADIYICDFHGEATSEKVAFGHAFDGKIQIIYGTHTHVQTNDERILEKGSAYITDVGMTGALDGVIGVKREVVVDRYLNNSSARFEPESSGKTQFNAILVDLNEQTNKVLKIEKIHIYE